ncbi:hypothetical protein CHS0354_018918 [Potamilus streckersoni]|uniref:NADH dehydrogenase [ubiquinone] 1 beta subcomplex subunit 9 n=1 Tax=Potamilus streckersoni TaxID=2493646 RepID=A0AAE0RNH0_9BIVA|nr:hypothetical protein CHS0354_018918 [Potamilus streckersoni]
MSYLQTKVLSHAQRVRKLYKEALREIYAHYHERAHVRYWCVMLRAKFDEHKNEPDMRKAKQLLLEGERKLQENRHPFPFKFPHSPGGVAYGRHPPTPDWILDTWHPLEKAQYPEYFARRDVRKREFIERWEKKYGKSEDTHHH